MSYYSGDIRLGDTIDLKFTSRSFSTGAPTQLAGSPAVAAYPANSTTEITAGITLSVDFDARTGLNNVRIVATSGNGYATATNYVLVLTAGTVGGVSVVGEVVGAFSIEARSALMPTTAARTLDVSTGGEAGLDWANTGSPTTTVGLTNTTVGIVTLLNGLAANVITATSIATEALANSKFADGALSAAKFASGAFDAVWSVAERLLTAGTNIVLAKGTGVTGFNDLSAADVNAEVDTALADYDGPTYTELLNLIRLALRKDAALATDLSALLASVNADLGSGGGAYANTTDAQEAIRDNQGTAQTGDAFARLGAPVGASISADIGTRASQTSVDTIDDMLDTEIPAIKAKTDQLTFTGANRVDASMAAIDNDTSAATNLKFSADTMVRGTVDTTGFTPTTTEFEAGDITEATADHYLGLTLKFTSGALSGQGTAITDYSLVGGRGHLTVVALTEPPASTDAFVIF
jgi:hypothetical protein